MWAAVAAWLTGAAGRRWILRALLAYALIGCVVWIRRPGDFAGYVIVGDLARSGAHIYRDAPPGLNTWPPFFSLLCVPLAVLATPTPYLARGLWLLLNIGLLLLVLHLICRLVYGRALSLRASGSTGISLAAPEMVVPLLITDRYVSGNFDHLQVNIVVFALALGGLYWQRRGRWLAGSTALGCAAAMKVMPVVFIPYLAYRRRWREAIATATATALLSLSPMLLFGWSRFWDYVAAWRAAVTLGWGVGKMNQSVFAMWDRWLGHGMLPFTVRGMNDLPESGALVVIVVSAFTLGLITAAACWLFRGEENDDWRTATEWSIVLIVSALFGPLTWKAYLVVLLLPHTLLFAAWRSVRLDARTRRMVGWVLLVAVVLGTLPSPGLVGKTLAGMLEMSSAVTLSALILLAGLLWFRARLARLEPIG
jgi:alpha-1,2-mannosyltransferase